MNVLVLVDILGTTLVVKPFSRILEGPPLQSLVDEVEKKTATKR